MNTSAMQPDLDIQRNGLGARVLVVDDEKYMCDVCSRTLQRSGYEVITANNPEVAIDLLKSEHFDLLLTDIKMPGMSGLDLANIARERDPAIAIIIMTGFASRENLQQSVQHGVADFLSKPFEIDQLRIAVDQALRKRGLIQDNLRLRAVEQLLVSSTALNATLDLHELGAILLRLTMAQSGCQTGFVVIEPSNESIIAAHSTSTLLPAGYELVGQALKQPILVEGSDVPFCVIEGRELCHAIAIALRAQGETSAVLVLCDQFSAKLRTGVGEEIKLLVNYAGAALRNAVLYNQLGDAYTRLQDLDQLKSEFIAVASHELRTPLAVVLGYAMMLRDQATNTQHREYLQRVLENAQRIRDIVDDMVSLRHLDIGDSGIKLELALLHDLLHQAHEQMLPIANERLQNLQLDLPERTIAFLCDREKVLLILGHLISNAVRFTPEGGTIHLRADLGSAGDRVGARSNGNPQFVLIEVHDTGIGIPEPEQSRIFDRFYQVADSLTRDHGGIGLGLAIVRELTATLGGEIWVKSQEGEGSMFTLALPYRQV